MTFVSKAKRWRPFIIRFWKREVGTLWLPFERERILEFSKIKPGEVIAITGYVKWITDNIFALLPTPFSNQIYLLCVNLTERKPNENSYIEIQGKAAWSQMRSVHPRSTLFKAKRIIYVYDWKDAKPDLTLPKLNFDYRDFKENLTYRIRNLEPNIADFLAFTALSTPPFYQNVGGINLTLYDSTTQGLPRLIVKEIRRVIPPDLHELHTVKTPFGRFAIRYKYGLFSANADKKLPHNIEVFLTKRTQPYIKDFDEVSLSLHSKRQKPMTIMDPPCSLSDIPTVIPEETVIDRGKSAFPEPDSFKYMIIQHMKTPIIKNYDETLVEIVNRLEKMTEDYGLDSTHLSRYGFLNANYNARPTSILREALAYARAHNINIIDFYVIDKIFDDYFEWNLNHVYDVWEDLIKKPGIPLSLRVEYRDIIRIIRKYEKDVNVEIIKSEAKTEPHETERLLKEMERAGLIYWSSPGRYRLIPSLF